MKASVGSSYSELDKHYEYYCDAENQWSWLGLGQTIPPEMEHCLYPYFPASFTGKRYTFKANDNLTLGRKCGKKLKKLFEKYGK